VLDLWLIVTATGWALEITLQGLILSDRFSLAWYMGRIFSLIASSVVLIVLLSEATTLYAHLARSVMRRRAARQGRQIAMDAMAASIVHEMNQPLGSISLNTEVALIHLASTPPNNAEVRAALEDIANASARGGQVISSLRSVFKKGIQTRTRFEVNNLVREVLGILEIELRSQGVRVSTDLREGLPTLFGDRSQLLQVFLNLIVNAAEAMRPIADRARTLFVTSRYERNSDELIFTIEDSGVGVGGKDLDTIFDPFFTTKTTGMGIGLTICRTIVGAHGGSLRASANKPHGTIFKIAIPSETETGD
jgi:signal transduction histidine kinase